MINICTNFIKTSKEFTRNTVNDISPYFSFYSFLIITFLYKRKIRLVKWVLVCNYLREFLKQISSHIGFVMPSDFNNFEQNKSLDENTGNQTEEDKQNWLVWNNLKYKEARNTLASLYLFIARTIDIFFHLVNGWQFIQVISCNLITTVLVAN